jgi:hypothetical protein
MTFIVLVVHYPVLVVQYNDPRTRMFEQTMDKIILNKTCLGTSINVYGTPTGDPG